MISGRAAETEAVGTGLGWHEREPRCVAHAVVVVRVTCPGVRKRGLACCDVERVFAVGERLRPIHKRAADPRDAQRYRAGIVGRVTADGEQSRLACLEVERSGCEPAVATALIAQRISGLRPSLDDCLRCVARGENRHARAPRDGVCGDDMERVPAVLGRCEPVVDGVVDGLHALAWCANTERRERQQRGRLCRAERGVSRGGARELRLR